MINIGKNIEATKCFKKLEFYQKKDVFSSVNLEMIDLAFMSKYCWSSVGIKVNFVRRDWKVSRVFAEVKLIEAALHYST